MILALPPALICSAVPTALCGDLIADIRASAMQRRSYQGLINLKLRDCYYALVERSLAKVLTNILEPIVTESMQQATTVYLSGGPMGYRYLVGAGFTLHHDEVTEVELQRAKVSGQPVLSGDYTAIVALSDPDSYSGGVLSFPEFGLSFKAGIGDVLVFPATRDYKHCVSPISAGERLVALARFARNRNA